LVGIGLGPNSLTLEELGAVKKCEKIYLENYTVDFPYKKEELEKSVGKKIFEIGREKVESEELVGEAKKKNVALLVYGDALSATTHSELVLSCKKNKVRYFIFHNASILTAVAESGLQLYKFGKTASMPSWKENWKPDSFMEIIKQNISIQAHTLLLVDINLPMAKAKAQLVGSFKNQNIKLEKIIVCSNLGARQKIFYDNIENISDKIKSPFCFIIPSKLHFIEEEFLDKI
jgi:diphthine synthase